MGTGWGSIEVENNKNRRHVMGHGDVAPSGICCRSIEVEHMGGVGINERGMKR